MRLPPPDLRMRDLAGRSVGVWGAGREGLAALRAIAADAPGAAVVVVSATPPPADEVLPPGPDGVPVRRLWGDEGLDALAACDVVLRSPGVPVRGADADRVRAGIPGGRDGDPLHAGPILTTGTALWMAERLPTDTVIGVTGTKGKSTTSALLHHLLGRAGIESRLMGNIGRPLLDELHPVRPPDAWVVELSSYQLADLPRAPTIAVVTNLMRDHLPWHGDEATYHADKLRILGDPHTTEARPTPRMAVLAHGDPGLRALGEDDGGRIRCPVLWSDLPDGLHVQGGSLRDGGRVLCALDDLPVRGATGGRNVALALTAVRALGHDVDDPAAALRDFRPLAHRQEVVTTDAAGVTWVDDSISTTPEAALVALAAFAPGPVVLVAGGVDRDQHWGPLAAALASGRVPTGGGEGTGTTDVGVAGLVALPGTGAALAAEVRAAAAVSGRDLPVREVGGTDPDAVVAGAVAAARELAPPGATVLLSPAAASHGVFRDFEDRGRRFAAAVRAS